MFAGIPLAFTFGFDAGAVRRLAGGVQTISGSNLLDSDLRRFKLSL